MGTATFDITGELLQQRDKGPRTQVVGRAEEIHRLFLSDEECAVAVVERKRYFVAPTRQPGFGDILDDEVRARFDAAWGSRIPPRYGMRLTKMFAAMEWGDMMTPSSDV